MDLVAACRAEAMNPDLVPVDWLKFWKHESAGEDWIIDPILPRGRHAGIFSSAGQGKSLLALDISAAMASGRSVLGRPSLPPIGVLYLDLEMTLEDLWDRLDDLGYGPDDDLSKLYYYQLPTLPPLDSQEGGAALATMVRRHRPGLVVLDTMTAIVAGEENSADTYRDFHRHTGLPLKSAGISLLRLDHAGKDVSRGQRGSSSKSDELDVVWQLTTSGNQVILTNKKRREPYVPVRVTLTKESDPELRHVLAPISWLAGASEVADLLDELHVPMDATAAVALQLLSASNQGRRKSVVLAALKLRRERTLARARTCRGEPRCGVESQPVQREPSSETPSLALLNARVKEMYSVPGTNRNQVRSSDGVSGNRVPPRRGEPVPDPLERCDHVLTDDECLTCGLPFQADLSPDALDVPDDETALTEGAEA